MAISFTIHVRTALGVVPLTRITPADRRSTEIVLRQGKGARAAWRDLFSSNIYLMIPESDEVKRWNEERAAALASRPSRIRLYGIRALYRRSEEVIERARMERREAVFVQARAQVGGLIIPDEHDPRL